MDYAISVSMGFLKRSSTGRLKSLNDLREMRGSSLTAKLRAIRYLRSGESIRKTEKGALIVANIVTWLVIEIVITITGTADKLRIFWTSVKNPERAIEEARAWLREPEPPRAFYEE